MNIIMMDEMSTEEDVYGFCQLKIKKKKKMFLKPFSLSFLG